MAVDNKYMPALQMLKSTLNSDVINRNTTTILLDAMRRYDQMVKNSETRGEPKDEAREIANFYWWGMRRYLLYREGFLDKHSWKKGNYDLNEDIFRWVPGFELALDFELRTLNLKQMNEYFAYRIDYIKEVIEERKRNGWYILAKNAKEEYDKIPFKFKENYKRHIAPLPDFSDLTFVNFEREKIEEIQKQEKLKVKSKDIKEKERKNVNQLDETYRIVKHLRVVK